MVLRVRAVRNTLFFFFNFFLFATFSFFASLQRSAYAVCFYRFLSKDAAKVQLFYHMTEPQKGLTFSNRLP